MIRKAKPSDVKALIGLWHRLMKHHMKRAGRNLKLAGCYLLSKNSEKAWTAWLKKNMRSKNGLVMVAEDKGELIGYSLNFIKKNVPVYRIERLGYVSDLFVAQPYRNKGVGRRFFLEAKKWFRKKGLSYASIGFHDINPDAGAAYRKWGFSDFVHELRMKI